jgi:hypothetical protein
MEWAKEGCLQLGSEDEEEPYVLVCEGVDVVEGLSVDCL